MTGSRLPWEQEEIDDALAALIGSAGRPNVAIRHLREAGKRTPAPKTLTDWARLTHWERYEELRAQFAEKRSDRLANDMLDTAERATAGASLAVDKALERLEEGKDDDPARSAASLIRVAQSATEKRQMLLGRPTSYSAPANPEAILRALVAKGVLQLADEPDADGESLELEAGDGTED